MWLSPLGEHLVAKSLIDPPEDQPRDNHRHDELPGSSTFGEWFGITLSDENKLQLYVPQGFAHGFCVTSQIADVAYKTTTLFEPSQDAGILWNDPDIGVKWPCEPETVSSKDRVAPLLNDVPKGYLPDYRK